MEVKMFSEAYKVFKNINLPYSVKKEDFLTIKNGEIIMPKLLDKILTVGVVKDINKDGSVNILVRNTRRDKKSFNRDIDFWESTLSKLTN
jgi:hypothetical protein